MYNLEERALLGDRSAQRECTEKGIVLPCPCCSSEDISYRTSEGDYDYGWGGFRCWNCNLGQGYEFATEEEALENWNTRPAPPSIIKEQCSICEYYIKDEECCNGICELKPGPVFEPEDYCNEFRSKED